MFVKKIKLLPRDSLLQDSVSQHSTAPLVLKKRAMHVPFVSHHWAEAETDLAQDLASQLLALGSVLLLVLILLNGTESFHHLFRCNFTCLCPARSNLQRAWSLHSIIGAQFVLHNSLTHCENPKVMVTKSYWTFKDFPNWTIEHNVAVSTCQQFFSTAKTMWMHFKNQFESPDALTRANAGCRAVW